MEALALSVNLRETCLSPVVAVIIAFLDDSGSHDERGLEPGSRVVATAGFVMLGERRPAFERDWSTILREFGVHEFHMKDFAHGHGEFQGWPQQRRDSLLGKLTAVVHEYALIGIGGLILVRDYEYVLPDWLKAEIGHPVCMAFAVCLEEFVRFLNGIEVRVRAPAEKIEIVFDRMPGYYEQLMGIHQRQKERDDRWDVLGGLRFGSRLEVPQIQAADLIVYEFRKELDRMHYDDGRPQRRSMEALRARQNLVVGYMDAERLTEFVRGLASA
ncbi:MAG: DUF3800 domain-containing protein [Candidatus Binataceae bacterium]